ncbi:SWI/SNF and RSC complex subunit Arp42 [Schizosaccharomyces cryophilus OY26]|uniref:SWI/SNF and RSC complex subunit Arp42 n=1 Tax=Schizosaccharomyces cryophilus (strain OY26 / ATCC MYA-4695 / CBS 11777 / NBRC 106824 / NRRL Y48691) TaxID=653667 RepID=S9W1Q7_SCHCR|nr:SWI/SNF and RSC complex subunit Arp42 [Schizosaccharomyces cryophilus OY26]EPY51950.1 SWI/SNF and RSC complex subunit Arp42 [Schizosaccharomyces cryophilus OY26]
MSRNSANLVEIPALVIDPGTCWTRFGFAGEESPDVTLPSNYGVLQDSNEEKNYIIDELQIHAPIPGMEIANGTNDGIIQDWESTLQIWKRGLKDKLKVDPAEYAMMITEPSWNTQAVRQQTMEAVFEQLQAPAFYLTKQAVCAAFASNKATALVVDLGTENTTVTPVVDGIAVRKGIMKQRIAGKFFNANVKSMFSKMNINVVPHYRVARKSVVIESSGPGNPEEVRPTVFYDPINGLKDSYEEFEKQRIIEEWKESVLETLDTPFDELKASTKNPKHFEFPDGSNYQFGIDRFRVGEVLFSPTFAANDSPESTLPEKAVGLHSLVYQSIVACESELRSQLFNNIVLTGGTSLIPGLAERLQNELQRLAPGNRIHVHTSGDSTYRSNASWLGGSILASLDNFQHLWVTKQEYDEVGVDRALFVEKRCK